MGDCRCVSSLRTTFTAAGSVARPLLLEPAGQAGELLREIRIDFVHDRFLKSA